MFLFLLFMFLGLFHKADVTFVTKSADPDSVLTNLSELLVGDAVNLQQQQLQPGKYSLLMLHYLFFYCSTTSSTAPLPLLLLLYYLYFYCSTTSSSTAALPLLLLHYLFSFCSTTSTSTAPQSHLLCHFCSLRAPLSVSPDKHHGIEDY